LVPAFPILCITLLLLVAETQVAEPLLAVVVLAVTGRLGLEQVEQSYLAEIRQLNHLFSR
jgi:hypothetical protein